ncbi:hypothetical protein EDS67_21010 [candidate division KSB1 bacterium]|nr:MAG: hypothetical protein EDS67_21010 [candidate division KSB1 bacterium]MBC6948252.1 hypothetical protein [candidate division KSB1 bacterium]MCE7943512.1 hypothetical protein [Chlorobi bacterium CHB1]MDL1877822.1 hypothetical protein [Cytophagia bacterium CHB2]
MIDNDTVFVHHASAALGTTTYWQTGESWQPRQKFVWALRDTSFTPQSRSRARGLFASQRLVGEQHEHGK